MGSAYLSPSRARNAGTSGDMAFGARSVLHVNSANSASSRSRPSGVCAACRGVRFPSAARRVSSPTSSRSGERRRYRCERHRQSPSSEERLAELARRRAEPEGSGAFIYAKAIDLETYERQRGRLRQELTLTQIDRHSVGKSNGRPERDTRLSIWRARWRRERFLLRVAEIERELTAATPMDH